MNAFVQVYRDTDCEGEMSFPLHWLDGGYVSVSVPRYANVSDGYRVDLYEPTPAGPAGWLNVTAEVTTYAGHRCGPRVPAQFYVRPWDVPSVVRFPQIPGESSVWTITFRVA